MAQVYTSAKIVFNDPDSYKIVMSLIIGFKMFDESRLHCYVKDMQIIIDEAFGWSDDVVKKIQIVCECIKTLKKRADDTEKKILDNISFVVEVHTEYDSYGEDEDLEIEYRKGGKLYERTSGSYSFYPSAQFSDYTEFCEFAEGKVFHDGEMVSEEDFPWNDYYVVDNEIWVGEEPDFDTPRLLLGKVKLGKAYSIDKLINEHFKKNNLCMEYQTINKLSIEDICEILSGTYKPGV